MVTSVTQGCPRSMGDRGDVMEGVDRLGALAPGPVVLRESYRTNDGASSQRAAPQMAPFELDLAPTMLVYKSEQTTESYLDRLWG